MNRKYWLKQYQYLLIGALVGLLIAILLITVGFFKSLLIVSLTLAGIWVANYLQQTQLLKRLFK